MSRPLLRLLLALVTLVGITSLAKADDCHDFNEALTSLLRARADFRRSDPAPVFGGYRFAAAQYTSQAINSVADAMALSHCSRHVTAREPEPGDSSCPWIQGAGNALEAALHQLDAVKGRTYFGFRVMAIFQTQMAIRGDKAALHFRKCNDNDDDDRD